MKLQPISILALAAALAAATPTTAFAKDAAAAPAPATEAPAEAAPADTTEGGDIVVSGRRTRSLGGVDVSVRRAGDALHVSFTTDTEHARALIAEAQPRLVELADARGVRIADSSVQTGTGGDRSGQQQPFQQAPQQVPRPAPAIASTITDSSDDDRLA